MAACEKFKKLLHVSNEPENRTVLTLTEYALKANSNYERELIVNTIFNFSDSNKSLLLLYVCHSILKFECEKKIGRNYSVLIEKKIFDLFITMYKKSGAVVRAKLEKLHNCFDRLISSDVLMGILTEMKSCNKDSVSHF